MDTIINLHLTLAETSARWPLVVLLWGSAAALIVYLIVRIARRGYF